MVKKNKNRIRVLLINFALAILIRYYNSNLIVKIKSRNEKKNSIIKLLQKWDIEERK